MALQAGVIAGRAKLGAVWFMAITAGHAGGEHFALFERAIVVDLVQHLPIGLVETPRNGGNGVCIRQPFTWPPILRKLATPGMTQPTGLSLLAQAEGQLAARGVAGPCINWPGNVATFIEANHKPFARIVRTRPWPPTLSAVCPTEVP